MDQQEEKKRALKGTLGSFIAANRLFGKGEERYFSPERGGTFRCPICGRKLGLFVKSDGYSDPWGINSFGHCPHFGHGGEYSSDIFGMYAAVYGISEKDAFSRLMKEEELTAPGTRRRQMQIAERERQEYGAAENGFIRKNMEKLDSLGYGKRMLPEGKALLEKRGIHIDSMSQRLRGLVSYMPETEFLSKSGSAYKAEGIVFRLGQDGSSFQIRKTHGGSYVSKDGSDFRFISMGPADCFNAECIADASGAPIFITEGPFDALSVIEAGGRNAVAVIGAGNHSRLIEAMRKRERPAVAFICFDPDEAGKNGAAKLYKELMAIDGITPLPFPLGGSCHDFNDLIMADRNSAEERIALASGIASSISAGYLSKRGAFRLIKALRTADAEGKGAERCSEMLSWLRGEWRKRKKHA